jgi:lipoprotein-releasing system permease protein
MFQPLPVFVGLRYSVAKEHSFFVSFITWVSLLGVALGVFALIVVLSVMNGFETELRGRLLSLSAHATLTAPGGAPIEAWRDTLGKLAKAPGLAAAAPMLDTDAMIKGQGGMSGAVLRGIDPKLEGQVASLDESMREGRVSDLKPGLNRIILGRLLAYQLQVAVGDTITVMIASGKQGDDANGFVPRLQEFEVSGIFEIGLQENDGVLALINLLDAQALRGLDGPTSIRLRFDDVLKAPQLSREAVALTPGLKVRDWTEENSAYFRAVRIEKTTTGIMLLLIVAIAVFNIIATLVMVVNDKRTDIAILRTLGLTPRGVMAVFVTQGVLIGWVGTALGVIAGVSVALNVDVIMPFIERTFGFYLFDPDVYYFSTLPSELHPADVVRIALAALLLTLVATIYPSLQASKTHPADALRYE